MRNPDDLLSAEEAAAIIGCTPRHVRRRVKAGTLPGKVIGGAYVIERADAESAAGFVVPEAAS